MRSNRSGAAGLASRSGRTPLSVPEERHVQRQPSRSDLLRHFTREAHILWGFVGGDVTAAVVPALCFTATAIPSLTVAPGIMAHALVYFLCFGLCFTIANQLTSLTEDRLNKPHRPLVQGLLTVRGGWVRWGIITLLFLGLGIQAHLLLPTLGWIGIALTSAAGWDRKWIWKQAMLLFGVIAQLSAAWLLAAPLTPLSMRWILGVAVVFAVLVTVQDLRDVAGDRTRGRRTLPIVWGDLPLRRFLVCAFVLLPLGLHVLLAWAFPWSLPRLVCESVLAMVSWTIAKRVWLRRTPRADHRTYFMFTLLYCLLLASCALLMHLPLR
jgi:4-hydroxybenzoate polyprenyltransferase